MGTKGKTIYVVTAGEYSDYHIVGVYSTRKLAELCKSATLADAVEEYELDFGDFRLHGAGYRFYMVTFEGENTFVELRGVDAEHTPKEQQIISFRGHPRMIRVLLYAKDEHYAVKIAADYRAQYIASGQYDLDVAENKFVVTHDLNVATFPELDRLHSSADAKPEVSDE